ncbi:hypothetical protein C2E23DRAFT_14079 [Lenzites betulinus]|nr:hypothetical protein C2E23DRAFT_14079 [Lenzites betulinus]
MRTLIPMLRLALAPLYPRGLGTYHLGTGTTPCHWWSELVCSFGRPLGFSCLPLPWVWVLAGPEWLLHDWTVGQHADDGLASSTYHNALHADTKKV